MQNKDSEFPKPVSAPNTPRNKVKVCC